MKTLCLLAALAAAVSLRAFAAESDAPPPDAAASADAGKPAASAKPAETPKAEEAPKAEAKAPEPAKVEEPAEAATAAKAGEPAKKPEAPKAKPLSADEHLQAEWNFLEVAGKSTDGDTQDAVIEELKSFTDAHLDAPMRPDALYLLAALRQKRADERGGLLDLLRVAYEYPDSRLALKAKSEFMEGSRRKFSGRLKNAEAALVKGIEGRDASARLALLAERLGTMEDAMYDASIEELHRFQRRFPNFEGADRIQWDVAQLHDKGGKPAAAVTAYQELLALYPASDLRAQAQFAVGVLLSDSLRQYQKAVDAFSELVDKYPDSKDILPALQRASQLQSDKLKQYQLAVETDEKIIKLFPKTDAALAAFKDEAKLQRYRLNDSGGAIKTDQRLADMFPAAAVEALREAAQIARKDLKDYKQEVDIRHGIAKKFASAKEAPEELFSAAEVCEDDLQDKDQAVSLYKELGTSFPGSKQAKKAEDRLAKLEKK